MTLAVAILLLQVLSGTCVDEVELDRLLDQKLLDIRPGLSLAGFREQFGGSEVTIDTRPDGRRSVSLTVKANLASRRAYRPLLCVVDAQDSIVSCKAESLRFHAQTADPSAVERLKEGATLLDVAVMLCRPGSEYYDESGSIQWSYTYPVRNGPHADGQLRLWFSPVGRLFKKEIIYR